MPARHILALDFPPVATPFTLRILDVSAYSNVVPIDCVRLEITPPGMSNPVYITDTDEIPQGGTWNITAEDLGLQPVGQTSALDLPDGLYHIRYSVSPNERVFVEYYHLRLTAAFNQLARLLCSVRAGECGVDEKLSPELENLYLVRLYLESARAKVETCGAADAGVALWQYAMKIMRNLSGPRVVLAPSCGCR